MTAQTEIFHKIVGRYMGGAIVTVNPGDAVSEVVEKMIRAKASSAVVTRPGGQALGIVTEQDVVRRLAFRAPAETPVETLMTSPVTTIREDDTLYHGIARMRRLRLRHMPVVNARGRVVGLLELHRALAVAQAGMLALIDRLTHEDSFDGLAESKAAQVEVAKALMDDNLPAPEIQVLLSDVNADIHHRVVQLCLAEMVESGWSEPPVAFTVLIMGSGGRGESFLFPDQDNGFILADYPDSEHDRIDAYFVELAERMTGALDRVGFPLCRGYVMAVNPLWRKTISQWREQLRLWQRKRDVVTLRLSDIFFDFRPIYGEAAMADDLQQQVTAVTKGNPSFLREMYRDDAEHRVALGLFGHLITVRENTEHKGKLNLKHTGTLPLVEGLRLLALREGLEKRSTLGRIEALGGLGVLNATEKADLAGAYRYISWLLMRQQIADHAAGVAVSNYVSPKLLSRREKDVLIASFKAIQGFRHRLKLDFTGEVF